MVEANKPVVRLVKGYLVFVEERLGKGQYGEVCKARLASEIQNKDCKTYACKIIDVSQITEKQLG
mgnify:CR=1 FL=1